jgi:voltage-gated potassium channel
MVLDVERTAAKANITTFPDALWWAVSTVTTVGYGDHYPVTAAGRGIGVALMLTGVGIFGVITASAAAWFVSIEAAETQDQQSAAITALTAEVTALRQTVSALSAQLATQPAQRDDPTDPGQHSSTPKQPPEKRATWDTSDNPHGASAA